MSLLSYMLIPIIGLGDDCMNPIECEILWTGDSERAQSLLSAIAPDDPDSFVAEIVQISEGNAELQIVVKGESLRSVRATVDDILACLGAAESTLDAVNDS